MHEVAKVLEFQLHPWPLPHPWKTEQSFFEKDVRSYSTSICNRDQQVGTEPGQSLRLATVSPTPTPTVYQPNQQALPPARCQVAEAAQWVPPPRGSRGRVEGPRHQDTRDSRARTRSPSPRAWRPDFPGAAREAPLDPRRATGDAKSLQSCLTLCNPIDGSPPGFPVPGILQARTLEWVAISFSNA